VLCLDEGGWRLYEEEHGVPAERLKDVTVGPDGMVWAASQTGLLGFDGRRWQIQRPGGSGLASGAVHAILVANDGRKWFGTSEGVLSCLDGETWTTNSIPISSNVKRVTALALDQRGRLCIARIGGVICVNGLSQTDHQTGAALSREILALAVDAQGRLWAGTQEGLGCFDGADWRTYTTADGLAHNCVFGLALDQAGRLWAATDGGVSCFDGQSFRTYHVDDGSEQAASVAVDAQGLVWVGFRGRGAASFDGDQWTEYRPSDGLADMHVSAIAVDTRGRKWFGTYRGMSCFDGQSWRTWTADDLHISDRVLSLAVDLDGSVWVGTDGGVSHIVLKEPE